VEPVLAANLSSRALVREVLLNDWDAHDIARRPEAHATYDVYIDPLLHLIESGADEDGIIQFLHDREAESMCFPALDSRRLKPVARKLLALRSK
jgi:hypothetical protein